MIKKARKLTAMAMVFSLVLTLSIYTMSSGKTEKINQKDMIYFLLTDRFYDGDKSNDKGIINGDLSQYQGGDFQGVIDKLDYIKELGFTAIWISPVVKNDLGGYHGYWATDFYSTNEHFGTMEKLKELVNKAHEKGIKVIFDLVVNHTGPGNPMVDNPKYPNWFHEHINISDYNNQSEVENGWLAGLPDFNTENPEVKKYLIDMAKWWIAQTGIDGYRLDTVRHVPKDFWKDFVSEIKKDYPDFYFVGEVFNGDESYVGSYQKTGIDGLVDFPTYFAINDVFKGDKPASYLANLIYKESLTYNNRALMGTFIDNHDVDRFVNQVYRLKTQKLEGALTFMLTYTGIPIMYYGTEIGMDGGTDPDNRGVMDFSIKSPVTAYLKKLTALRKTNSALTDGDIKVLKSSDSFLSFVRNYNNNTVVTAFSTSESKQKITLNIPTKYIGKIKSIKDTISSKSYSVNNGKVTLNMDPIQSMIFVINK